VKKSNGTPEANIQVKRCGEEQTEIERGPEKRLRPMQGQVRREWQSREQ